jgi:aconitase B
MQMKMRITGPLSSALGQILGNAVASGVGGYMTKVFEPSSVTTAKGDVLGVEGTGLSSVTPYTGPQWSFAQGTQYVPFDMVAQIHRGEKIVPAVENRGSGDASIVINQPITLNATNASPETISMIRKMMPALIAENKQAVVNSVNQALAAQGRRAFA